MKETIINLIKEHNERIDRFVIDELPELLGYEKGVTKISMNDYIKAMDLISSQNFYENARKLLLLAQEIGIKCRINMQNSKISY